MLCETPLSPRPRERGLDLTGDRDGGRLQGNTVDLAARTDIDNLSGKIGGNTVSLDAGRDINIRTRTRTRTIDSAGLPWVGPTRPGLGGGASTDGDHKEKHT